MTDKVLVQNKRNTSANIIESFYNSPSGAGNNGTNIKAFTASNDTTTSHSYKAYIYGADGLSVLAVIPQSIVIRNKSNYGPPILGQVIPKGGSLRMESTSTDGSFLNYYVTGADL
jgi:hypothetical protein